MKRVTALLLMIVVSSSPGLAQERVCWNLPQTLSLKNTKIEFIVDTTWHSVEGQVKELSGDARLTNASDCNSVQLAVEFPVGQMDTDSKSRDEEMRAVMDEHLFPKVKFTLRRADLNACQPTSLPTAMPCAFNASGDLTIRDVTRAVQISAKVMKSADGSFRIDGETAFNWDDFGVKDASILIARVHKQVQVKFGLDLPKD